MHRRTLIAALLALLGAGCGYRVGPNYSPNVRTVHIPVFKTESFRRGFELQLTEAVQKQVQTTTPYRLANEPMADTRLIGRIVEISKRPVNQNRYDDPRELELSMAVEVRWEECSSGRVLRQQMFPINPMATQAISQVTFAPEAGQSMATATKDAVDQLSAQIVQLMEAPW
ncbi:hypothetical protein Pan44_53130 [Caulifigura coniformis]|uniref:Lipopolysaccharide-assembly n=1 Tax=Caulifigura coniformis TaxID=2527983 RepID=A0A517SM94_9PLAN|nr:LptE family protein [Caulifigura coniformis]QDT57245.1 hypothetical protein Pan44_53130 [Caulifigura coniformis]